MTTSHYDEAYWIYQRRIGRVGGELNLWKFAPHIKPTDTVVDFGCGGGYLLARIDAQVKIGVDPNPVARQEAERNGVDTVESLGDLPADSADVVISNHALEHALTPAAELRAIHRVLRRDGRLVLVVPLSDWRVERTFNRADPNHHLHAWTPQILGNLLTECSFSVQRVQLSTNAWRPGFERLRRVLPQPVYRLVGAGFSVLRRRREIHALATPS